MVQEYFKSSRVKRLDIWDIALIKLGCVAFGILLGVYFFDVIRINPLLWILLVILLQIRPAYRWFKK